MTELFVLAGGEGSRFFPFTVLTPKCLINVAGKPCIRWIIDDAIEQDCFANIIVCINMKDRLEFEHELRDLDIVSLSVSKEPLGTMGELINAMPIIDNVFVVRYGDDLTEVNYRKLLLTNQQHDAAMTLAVTTKYELPIGIMGFKESGMMFSGSTHIVDRFVEKPVLDKPIWTGVACMNYDKVRPYFRMGDDIARDLIPKMLESGETIAAYNTGSHWYDIGNIENYRKADEHYRRNKL